MGDNKRLELTEKASQDTLMALVQLDPMPMLDALSGNDMASLASGLGEGLIDSTAAAELSADGSQQPQLVTGTTGAALGLSSSGHGAIYYLTRVQRYSSYAFAIFSSAHFVTTSLVPLATRSVPASESFLLLAREIYQTRLSEPLLVAVPIVAHIMAGLGLRLVRRSHNLLRYGGVTARSWPIHSARAVASKSKQSSTTEEDGGACIKASWPGQRNIQQALQQVWLWAWRGTERVRTICAGLCAGWPPLSVTSASGYALSVAVLAHVAVNRILPLAVEGDSADIGLAYVSHGFSRHKATAWLSYGALLALFSGHFVWGWARWLNLSQRAAWDSRPLFSAGRKSIGSVVVTDSAFKRKRRATWLVLQGAAATLFVLWAAGGLGVVAQGGRAQGWVGDVYDGLFTRVLL